MVSDVAPQGEGRFQSWRRHRRHVRKVVVGLLLVYVFVFAALNTHHTRIDFVFYSVRTRTLFALAVVAALSFVAGYLLRGRRARRH